MNINYAWIIGYIKTNRNTEVEEFE